MLFSLGAIPFSCSFHRPPQTSAGLSSLLRASRSPALVHCRAVEAALFASSCAVEVVCSIYCRAVKVVRSVDCRSVEAALSDSSRAVEKRALFIVRSVLQEQDEATRARRYRFLKQGKRKKRTLYLELKKIQ